jgi:hypothetical protein
MWDAFEARTGKPVPGDLPTLLSAAREAFEKLRYSYETDVTGISYLLGDLPWLLRREILTRHPEWRHLRPRIEEHQLAPNKPDETNLSDRQEETPPG